MQNKILHGDCLERLKELPDNSVDSVVTDPPYGLSKEPDITEVLTKWMAGEPYDHGHKGFMGKDWDSFVPHPDIWKEVIRVLKPGGHALVFAGTRTQDLMTISLRLAGFEVRDVIEWIYFSGFPKNHNVGKAFDRRAGAERKVVGIKQDADGRSRSSEDWAEGNKDTTFRSSKLSDNYETAPSTNLARKWDGWGTVLKPAHEPIIVVRKPFKGTVAGNVEEYGTGAINIDASRVDYADEADKAGAVPGSFNYSEKKLETGDMYLSGKTKSKLAESWEQPPGRFPANCITLDFDEFYSKYFNVSPQEVSKKASKRDRNSDWRGNEIEIEGSSSIAIGGRGNVKGSCGTHNKGLKSGESSYPCGCPIQFILSDPVIQKNNHPTVKPTDLMAWLVRLITPPNGVVLDPFAGSGSTLVAAKREGFGFIGIEREAEYIEICEARTGENRTDEKELQLV